MTKAENGGDKLFVFKEFIILCRNITLKKYDKPRQSVSLKIFMLSIVVVLSSFCQQFSASSYLHIYSITYDKIKYNKT